MLTLHITQDTADCGEAAELCPPIRVGITTHFCTSNKTPPRTKTKDKEEVVLVYLEKQSSPLLAIHEFGGAALY